MNYILKILSISKATPDVLHIVTDKPLDLQFLPGQAADISINKSPWEEELRPFTFTSLPTDATLEFLIKTYPSHHGVTNELLTLSENDELILHGVFGDIQYKGEGIFMAGGAGITPFVSIFKDLKSKGLVGNNKLIFANKTVEDIIEKEAFQDLLGENFINVLSQESVAGYETGYITEELISRCIDGTGLYYYLCGPEPMMDAVEGQLATLGISNEFIVKESF